MGVQRVLATAVWVLTAGVVVSVEVVLARLLLPLGTPLYFLLASLVVALVAFVYMRRLSPRLHRDDRPRWRLTPGEAARVLPPTLGVFVLAAGVATSTYWPDWVGSLIGAVALAALSEYALRRWDDRWTGPSVA